VNQYSLGPCAKRRAPEQSLCNAVNATVVRAVHSAPSMRAAPNTTRQATEYECSAQMRRTLLRRRPRGKQKARRTTQTGDFRLRRERCVQQAWVPAALGTPVSGRDATPPPQGHSKSDMPLGVYRRPASMPTASATAAIQSSGRLQLAKRAKSF